MILLFISFIAGVLTVLAPCSFALLPVIIGGTATDSTNKKKALVVIGSLALSIVAFTLILKASTVFIIVPPQFWTILSGSILILFALTMIFPALWEKISAKFNLAERSNELLAVGYQKKSSWGDILMGAALGPVFSSCSPTYFVILASVLPASYTLGIFYLIAYSAGLSLMLLLVATLGQKFVIKIGWAVDPRGFFKRMVGLLFFLVAVFIFFGFDKKLQIYILDQGLFDITKVEQYITEKLNNDCPSGICETEEPNQSATSTTIQESKPQKSVNESKFKNYTEIVNPSGFVNSEPFQLKDFIGKKVILLDFMTYSCINCQRTFPYLNEWYKKYKDEGLLIVGMHTPEFAFEHNIENVRKAAQEFGLEFPLVLDNDYATWNAYNNRYWPHKYLIDKNGKIVYDHIGEGAYAETEKKIQELLAVSSQITSTTTALGGASLYQSPETYFGSLRNGGEGNQFLELSGSWKVEPEYAESTSSNASIIYKYNAGKVFLVMEAIDSVVVSVFLDGKEITKEMAGKDVVDGKLDVKDPRLYEIISGPFGSHTLELKVNASGLRAYAFTFGS